MSIAQLAPTARVEGQPAALALAKPVPDTEIVPTAIGAVPMFCSVTVRAGKSPPTVWVPKSSGEGARLASGAGTGTPLPATAMATGPLLASDAIVREAERAPSAVGVKVTVIVHVAAIARAEPTVHVPP